MLDNNKRIDRYGWLTNEKIPKTEKEVQLELEESRIEHLRESKWAEMATKWEYWMKEKRDKIASRIKKGIPDSFRFKIWSLLTTAEQSLENSAITLNELLQKDPLPVYDVIKSDVNRAFPQIEMFSKPDFSHSLEKILCAYAQIDESVEYVQGMGYIAGILLLYLEEEMAFWAFHNVMNGFRTLHRDYFTKDHPRLKLAQTMLRSLVKDRYPRVFSHIEELGVTFDLFCPKWFFWVFLSFDWPPVVILRIFDRFLFYGTRCLLSFALVIFSRHKSEMETMSSEELVSLLQYPHLSPKMNDWRYLFIKWDSLWITKRQYQSLLKNAGAPPERLE